MQREPKDPDPATLFSQAAELLRQRDPAAMQLLPKLERFPDFASGWLELGLVFESSGTPAAAELSFRRAAAADNASVATLHKAGQGLARLGLAEPAAAAFRRALGIAPEVAACWYSLGLVSQDLRDLPAAAEAFAAALQLRPAFHEAAFNLGVVRQEMGAVEAALDAYAEAFRLAPASLGRIAQALIAASSGMLFLRPDALRSALAGRAASV